MGLVTMRGHVLIWPIFEQKVEDKWNWRHRRLSVLNGLKEDCNIDRYMELKGDTCDYQRY